MNSHRKNSPHFYEELYPSFEKRNKKKNNRDERRKKDHCEPERQFRCGNCGAIVSTDRELVGVNNRNHCPNCLWSKHVDDLRAGDRCSGCGARMRPLGLTVKKVHKKYAVNEEGELMLIHNCIRCGKIFINRIAADDSTGALIALYHEAGQITDEILEKLAGQDIHLLAAGDLTTVFSQLFGWQAILDMFEEENQSIRSEEAFVEQSQLED